MPDITETPEALISLQDVLDLIAERRGKRIAASTWRSYVAREQAPKPVKYQGREPLYSPTEIIDWIDERPGPGRWASSRTQ
ncbi:transcriptional regulator [Rhodococcus sp. IEGM 1374]|uniref:helix-turn-helix transcriptional regulator n=1 Tax=Rhodococcus sp. IEGM 1374 TaxID=3082221 RepID=UPI002954EA02|nr:transcriptional regulator [Rhodococcus sp. IEGM 1374]MDV7991605.1 transcriptional regulator [Rhodococcus sp. IEGM 1374]